MAEILQGTTPSLEIKISTDDFLVSDVVALEWVIQHNNTIVLGLSDVDVNTTNNSVVFTFTEAQTLEMSTRRDVVCQIRFMFANGRIVGTAPMSFKVANLISRDVMTT